MKTNYLLVLSTFILFSCNTTKVENIKSLDALIYQTYMFGIILAFIALVLAFIVSNIIKFQGGKNPRDHITRRVWFILIGILAPIVFFLYNALYTSSYIIKAPLLAKFSIANILATLAILVLYAVVGVLSMLIFRRSKWGSILGKSKN